MGKRRENMSLPRLWCGATTVPRVLTPVLTAQPFARDRLVPLLAASTLAVWPASQESIPGRI